MSQEDKELSHARIVASASRLVREKGLEGASVAEVMKDAGMTHGGFYKHFDNKDELIAAALGAAFSEFSAALETGDPRTAFAAYRRRYLSREHMSNPGLGCPAAALGAEVARESKHLKAAFGDGARRLVNAVARGLKGSPAARRKAAFREISMLVGAIIVARASDSELAAEILAACRDEPKSLQQAKGKASQQISQGSLS
jgi:TetR/AcrR family transcriptional repressor of nem operon